MPFPRGTERLDPSAETAVAAVGAASASSARSFLQGAAQAGAGIRSGIQQAGAGIARGIELAGDPERAERARLVRQRAADDLLVRSAKAVTPAEYVQQQGAEVPPMEGIVANLWDRVTHQPGGFSRLDTQARERIVQLGQSVASTPYTVADDIPDRAGLMQSASPHVARDERLAGIPRAEFGARVERDMKQAIFNDPTLSRLLVQQRLSEEPAEQAEARGQRGVAAVLRANRNDPLAVQAATSIGKSLFAAGGGMGAHSSLLSFAMAEAGDISPGQWAELTGHVRVGAHPAALDSAGRVIQSMAHPTMLAWQKSLDDGQKAVVARHKLGSPQEALGAVHRYEWAGKLLAGLTGSPQGGAAERVKSGVNQLVERFGRDAVQGYLGSVFLDTPFDGELLGLAPTQVAEMDRLAQPVVREVVRQGVVVEGLPMHDKPRLHAQVYEDWSKQLTTKEVVVPGPLAHLSDIPAEVGADLLNQIGTYYRQDRVARQAMDALRRHAGEQAEQLFPQVASAVYAQLDWLQSRMPEIDEKGRAWDALPESDRAAIVYDAVEQAAAGHGIRDDAVAAGATVSEPMEPRTVTRAQAAALHKASGLPASGLSEVAVPRQDGTMETVYFRDGQPIMTAVEGASGERRELRFDQAFAAEKGAAWAPALDIFEDQARQVGGAQWRQAYPTFYASFQTAPSASGPLNALLMAQVSGKPVYQWLEGAMRGVTAGDGGVAYDRVVGILSNEAQRLGMDLATLRHEAGFADAYGTADPVVKGLALLLEESLSAHKLHSEDQQMMRTPERAGPHQGDAQQPSSGSIDPLLDGYRQIIEDSPSDKSDFLQKAEWLKNWEALPLGMERAKGLGESMEKTYDAPRFHRDLGVANVLVPGARLFREGAVAAGHAISALAAGGEAIADIVRPKDYKAYQRAAAAARFARGEPYRDPSTGATLEPGSPGYGRYRGESLK